jgi:hypothetical protein
MKNRLCVSSAALAMFLVTGGQIFAQSPANNISPSRHPHLASAQKLATQAFEQITIAQKANKYDMKGHAAKAKQLLIEANQELKAAADVANQQRK